MLPHGIHPHDVLREDSYNGHMYVVAQVETDTVDGFPYEFRLYIDSQFVTTARRLDEEWHPNKPWSDILSVYAEAEIDQNSVRF